MSTDSSQQYWFLALIVLLMFVISAVGRLVLASQQAIGMQEQLRVENVRLAIEVLRARADAEYKTTIAYEELRRKEDLGEAHPGEEVYMLVAPGVLNGSDKPAPDVAQTSRETRLANMTVPSRWWLFWEERVIAVVRPPVDETAGNLAVPAARGSSVMPMPPAVGEPGATLTPASSSAVPASAQPGADAAPTAATGPTT